MSKEDYKIYPNFGEDLQKFTKIIEKKCENSCENCDCGDEHEECENEDLPQHEHFAEQVINLANDFANFLIEKNESYGDAALEPINIFSKGLTKEQKIYVRLDDKLTRVKNGHEYPGDDTIKDIIGYLFLLMILKGAKI